MCFNTYQTTLWRGRKWKKKSWSDAFAQKWLDRLVKPSTMCMNSLVPDSQKFHPWVIKKDRFCGNKIFFMLQFGNCFPLPVKEKTTLRVIFFYVYLWKTFIAPDGLMALPLKLAVVTLQWLSYSAFIEIFFTLKISINIGSAVRWLSYSASSELLYNVQWMKMLRYNK